MPKTGGHFKRCNVGSVEAHNERTQAYLDGVKAAGLPLYFFHNLTPNNTHWVNDECQEFAGKSCSQIFEFLKNLYKEKFGQAPNLKDRIRINKKTGKEYTVSWWSPIREAVIPIKEDTTIEDFKDVIAWLKKHDIEVIRIDLHKDEGYKDPETGEVKMNYHAHLVACWVNLQTGNTANLKQNKMTEWNQVVLPNALNMEAGIPKAVTGKEHLSPAAQRAKAEAERQRKKANALEEQNKELQQKNKDLQERNKELQQKVGTGAQVKAFFGVGPLADIRSDLKTAEKEKAEAIKDKEAAEKALQDAKDAHAEELATARRESRQKGYDAAVEDIKKATLLTSRKNLKEIGEAVRASLVRQNELQEKVKVLEAEKRQAQEKVQEPLQQLNKVLRHYLLPIFDTESMKEAEKVAERNAVGLIDSGKRLQFCNAVVAWGEQKHRLIDEHSPKALMTLQKLFEAMKEAWEMLLSAVRESTGYRPQVVLEDVSLQLRLTPGALQVVEGWEEALHLTPEQHLARYQSSVRQQSNVEQQHVQEKDLEEEQSYSHGWRK